MFNSVGIYLAVRDSERLSRQKRNTVCVADHDDRADHSVHHVRESSIPWWMSLHRPDALSYVAYELVYGGRAVQIWSSMNMVKYRKKEELKS